MFLGSQDEEQGAEGMELRSIAVLKLKKEERFRE
jgi:hypothetical protein